MGMEPVIGSENPATNYWPIEDWFISVPKHAESFKHTTEYQRCQLERVLSSVQIG